MHVWQNTIDDQAYTNSLSRVDGSLTVIAENVLVTNKDSQLLELCYLARIKTNFYSKKLIKIDNGSSEPFFLN
jgi:hypothetical protein